MSDRATDAMDRPGRVVEASFRWPHADEIKIPEVDWEPLAELGREALLTTVGVGILVGRGVASAVKAAYQAGLSEASRPDSWLASLVGGTSEGVTAAEKAGGVSALPIADYDALSADEVLSRLEGLDRAQLGVVSRYEISHANRPEVLKAIAARLV
ncbi:MAG: hypothetical protein ACP5G7_11840 [Anaerolineae bacterium]